MKTTNLLLVIIIAMTLFNCNNNDSDTSKKSETQSNKSDHITVQFLKSEFDSGKKFYLLDVRTIPEFNQGRLSFANDLIPYDALPQHLDKLPQDKEATIYLFCRSGRRSGIATKFLRSAGYNESYNITGGIIAWQNAGFEIVSGN